MSTNSGYQDVGKVQNAVITLGIVTCLVGSINLALAYTGYVGLFGFAELATLALLAADIRYYRLDQLLGFPIHGISWSWDDNIVMIALMMSIVLSVVASYMAIVYGIAVVTIPWLHVALAITAIVAIIASLGQKPD